MVVTLRTRIRGTSGPFSGALAHHHYCISVSVGEAASSRASYKKALADWHHWPHQSPESKVTSHQSPAQAILTGESVTGSGYFGPVSGRISTGTGNGDPVKAHRSRSGNMNNGHAHRRRGRRRRRYDSERIPGDQQCGRCGVEETPWIPDRLVWLCGERAYQRVAEGSSHAPRPVSKNGGDAASECDINHGIQASPPTRRE